MAVERTHHCDPILPGLAFFFTANSLILQFPKEPALVVRSRSTAKRMATIFGGIIGGRVSLFSNTGVFLEKLVVFVRVHPDGARGIGTGINLCRNCVNQED